MLQRTPERFDHRVGEGNLDLREHAVQTRAEQRGLHRTVDVLDAGVGVQKGPTGEDEMPASCEKKLARRRGLESDSHGPVEDLPRVVVDDRVEIRPGSVEQLEDGRVDVPSFIGLRGPDTDGGFGRMNALPRPTPAALTEAKTLPIRWAWRASVRRAMWRFSGANTMSLMLATSVGVSWLGLVRGQEDRSSKPQARVEARCHAWYRPGSRCTA